MLSYNALFYHLISKLEFASLTLISMGARNPKMLILVTGHTKPK